jgi:hypothetical protein
MSHMTLYEFRDGRPRAAQEFKNAWGGAAYIWTRLYDKYLKDPADATDSWMISCQRLGEQSPLWELPRNIDKPLQLFERAVLASTFTRAIVVRANFPPFTEHLSQFVREYPPNGGACHLLDWADRISISVADAIGFAMTTTADDPWFRIGEDGELVAYNINNDKQHFEVYAWLHMNGIRLR